MRILKYLAAGAASALVCLSAAANPPVTVADAVSMVRIAEPDQRFEPSNDFRFSPDGRHVAVATYRGNLQTWRNDYTIIVYDTAEVLRFVNDAAAPAPSGSTLARISAATNDHSVRSLRWLPDNKTLAMLIDGKDDNPAQVFTLDIETGQLTQLTHHAKSVQKFDFNLTSDRVAYVSYTDVPIADFSKPQFVVGNKSISDMTARGDVDPWNIQFYSTRKGQTSPGVAAGGSFPKEGGRPSDLWLSPDGRYAIAVKLTEKLPAEWDSSLAGAARGPMSKFDDYYMGYRMGLPTQYVLLDLEKDTVQPVFAALKPSSGMQGAYWLEGAKSVMLPNTHLPLDVPDAQERSRRLRMTSVVEFDPGTGKATRIADIPVAESGKPPSERLTDAAANPDGTVTLRWQTADKKQLARTYRKRAGQWKSIAEAPVAQPRGNRLALSIKQGPTTPPDIVARDTETGQERQLTDLNPQLRQLSFGKVERADWSDSQGRKWQGALVFPPDFKPGQRYPLIVQTAAAGSDGDKYELKEFLIDGPVYSSAYAAQAYAGRGMMVLQIPNPWPPNLRLLAQQKDTRLLIEGAIDELDRKGLIDRKRVAMIGFSNTCVPVWYTLTHSDYDFAAALVADGFSNGDWGYAFTFGVKSPGMLYIEDFVMDGAKPWGERLQDWIAQSPSFHLDKVDAAVRIEAYNTNTLPMDWDLYATLRRLHKPVEYAVLNAGAHNNLKPRERYLSQQGNVDWFAFWLKGEEDRDPAKAEQYERWRRMRLKD